MTVTALGSEKSYACFFVCSVCICVFMCVYLCLCVILCLCIPLNVCVCTCAIVWCVCHCVCVPCLIQMCFPSLEHRPHLQVPPRGCVCGCQRTRSSSHKESRSVLLAHLSQTMSDVCETWSRVPSNKRQLHTAEGGVPLRLQAGNSDLNLSCGRKAQIRELSQVYESGYWEPRAAGSGEYQRAAE